MFVVAALYQFTPFPDVATLKPPLEEVARLGGVHGTVLLAPEGINGTIAGPRAGIDTTLAHIRTLPGCEELEVKESTAEEMPFKRLKVRLKREIVTLKQPQVDPTQQVGTYVEPSDWNDLISRDDVVLIDTRNDYEVDIGTFEGAIDPETRSFSEFPDWWEKNAERFEGKQVAMFCTGGIRCEKASSYLLSKGVDEVFHLRGGILKYLENINASSSLWTGECFVFDKRVAVGHKLVEGSYDLCFACRRPVSAADKLSASFEEGVSCAKCIEEHTDADRVRFRDRQQQIERERGLQTVKFGSPESTEET